MIFEKYVVSRLKLAAMGWTKCTTTQTAKGKRVRMESPEPPT